MTENERVREIRKNRKLTMREFGRVIGLASSTISDIENGKRKLTAQNRITICREFGVNENWLRTGEGEMYVKRSRQAEITAFFDDITTDNQGFRARLISVLAKLPPQHWIALQEMAERLLAEMGAESEPAPPAAPTREELHEALDRQLDLEQEAREKSGVS